ncbi:phosphoglucomutase (alpha-D-glucose-1,6-bisphosphate-dependent) [Litorihabitans aurantiacus]|uniref:Phosphoglucomutase, alpha-D-glucose phosphate-specific n=1 Tax=Litorihabitans aurantiacus TaxID=1930061 RepID=A0AA37XHJ3_9MICO|nr:phosphoglucomutase (alpha-D-glucose-1,6-bisphosphate-dependent) [Litorihabitans aurantiacus]GMA33405.1 phosphoglucomutase, alpha-D-glucose phosphate-specific [Litorihabitans aurantiacus]
MHPRAGQLALPEDLIDVEQLIGAYHDLVPDSGDPAQHVVFGTSGHRGTSLNGSFTETHVAAIAAAVVEYRRAQGIDGPIYVGRDTHALSEPAQRTVVEVLVAAGAQVRVDARDSSTPTPAVSHSILLHNGAATADGVRTQGPGRADGIVITPSHNPPTDGGIKYNATDGGPAGGDVTGWIARRANELVRAGLASIERVPYERAITNELVVKHDYMSTYVDDLDSVIDLEAIRAAGVRIAADTLGGAAVDYWAEIGERYGLDLTVIHPETDPQFSFMTLDWDGKIRMDCSSPHAMASLRELMSPTGPNSGKYDIATGNDGDADRHGIVTPDGGLMNPNHFLAVAIDHLFRTRTDWPGRAGVGKTLVSSSLIDKVAADLGRPLIETPVGFKYFAEGLLDSSMGFGGEESAGASFLRRNGTVWTTDKDGFILDLLASEIIATTGESPSAAHAELVEKHGESWYARVDAVATREEKAKLKDLSPDAVTATTLAGQEITGRLVTAPGNGAAIGGLKVTTADAWFAARPSGTEDVYKIYAESFVSADHLTQVQDAARAVVADAIG